MRKPVIDVRAVSRTYGNFTAVDDVSFSVGVGEIFGLLGGNGAGKTTLMKMLCGLTAPTKGELWVAGFNVAKDPQQVKSNIGYMSQRFSLYQDLTVEDNIWTYGGLYNMPRKLIKTSIPGILTSLNLNQHRRTRVSQLETGDQQKLSFAIAINHSPKVVFLDEPTGGVNTFTRRRFWEMIQAAVQRPMTVFVCTHFLDEAEYCDRVAIMQQGEIFALDTPAAIKKLTRTSSMEQAFARIISEPKTST